MQTIATPTGATSFVGVLTDRHYKPGQKYMQLVFKTADGAKVSLSRNVRLVRSLRIGVTYQIEGQERSMGSKVFITEPTATPVPYQLKLSRGRRLKFFSATAALLLIGGGGYVLINSHHSVQLQATSAAHQTDLPTTVSATTPTVNVVTPTPPVTTPTPSTSSAATVTKTVAKAKTVTPAIVPAPAPAQVAAVTVPPAPDPATPTDGSGDTSTPLSTDPPVNSPPVTDPTVPANGTDTSL